MNELSPRQAQVLPLIERGFTNQEIAAILGVSVYTAKAHVTRLCEKIRRPDGQRSSKRDLIKRAAGKPTLTLPSANPPLLTDKVWFDPPTMTWHSKEK